MKHAALIFLLVLSASAQPLLAVEPKAKPNVLFIAVDDLNHWVGYLGRNEQVKTPNLDRLARRGVRFTRSYCASPLCNPSRTALLSGLRPSTSGVYGNFQDWRDAIPENLTLPTTFRKNGYFVAGAGKVYDDSVRRESEWEAYLAKGPKDPPPKEKDPGVGGNRTLIGGQRIRFAPLDYPEMDLRDYCTVSWVLEQLNRKHDRPFFLACGLVKPHLPWYVPRKYYDLYPLDQIVLPKVLDTDLDDVPPVGVQMATTYFVAGAKIYQSVHDDILKWGRWKEAVQGYLAAISFCDAMVGRLIDGLDRSPYRDNTVIVLWSDHGFHLGEKRHWEKCTLWEEGTRAPLIWVVPELTKADGVCQRTVDFMSVYPTLTDVCGLPTPKHVEGESIRPLLANPDAPWDRPARTTFEFNNHAVRTEQCRYIRYHDGGEELYDETKDPLEWTNLAAKPEYAAVKKDLAKWLPKVNTPPRPNTIPPPRGEPGAKSGPGAGR
jgi:arylsulfatase A-like enzyme